MMHAHSAGEDLDMCALQCIHVAYSKAVLCVGTWHAMGWARLPSISSILQYSICENSTPNRRIRRHSRSAADGLSARQKPISNGDTFRSRSDIESARIRSSVASACGSSPCCTCTRNSEAKVASFTTPAVFARWKMRLAS